ncbi:unnamed protein product [Nesidiocoris tenuis]|uniref:Uncharacterized protein n=1 Tax=Nesidiocoris tenuis TaxID=355587 RepID=A0A6H5G1N9_9HEMI|nr:unnamed protein product [Nesidiocoris tenuis]
MNITRRKVMAIRYPLQLLQCNGNGIYPQTQMENPKVSNPESPSRSPNRTFSCMRTFDQHSLFYEAYLVSQV